MVGSNTGVIQPDIFEADMGYKEEGEDLNLQDSLQVNPSEW